MSLQDIPFHRWDAQRAALIIAHPGHELRIYHWLERARPLVLVLTDGSGHTNHSRLGSTTAVLEKAGAVAGSIYGRVSDQELYRAILSRDADFFVALVEEIAQILRREGTEYVVGDAVEGANPGHDVCRLLLNAALSRVEQAHDRRPGNFEFPLEGPSYDGRSEEHPDAILLHLDDEAYHRKLAAAQFYPEIAADLARTLSIHDRELFRIECLRPVHYGLEIDHCFEHPPLYETYGEKQVAAGLYRDVIRFREHLVPLAERLREAQK